MAALLVVAFVVSAWQVRGSTFSIGFAVIPLSAWIAKWRQRAEVSPSRGVVAAHGRSLAGVGERRLDRCGGGNLGGARIQEHCGGRQRDRQAVLPHGDLCAARPTCRIPLCWRSPISARRSWPIRDIACSPGPIIATSPATCLALDAFLGSADNARKIVADHHVGLVALCRGSAESELLTEKAPQGFLAGLMRGSVPDWLEPVAETKGTPIELYRVRQGA